jgi:uncharacterized membrane protein YdbT with pleckstrin-like domain
MTEEYLQVEDLIRHISLFQGLEDHQISSLVDQMEMVYLDAGELLFAEGDQGDSFYIIFRGEVEVTRGRGEGEQVVANYVSGDYFGEEAIMYGRPRSASVTSITPTSLLRISGDLYAALLQDSTEFAPNLEAAAESHKLAGKVEFSWLNPDEVVHLIARKHPARLWLALAAPVIVGLFSVPLFFMAYLTGTITPALFGGVLLLFVFLWGIWNGVDWGNDYYLVTNQRVVWLERVIALYESRQEAPLRTILSVGVESDQLGRILGYGDVIVRTYTGRILMRNIGHPAQMAALIEQYWMRSRKESDLAQSDAMVRSLREHLGLPMDEEQVADLELEADISEAPVPTAYRPSIINLILANYFKMRYQEGSVITYRKHWFIFLSRMWQPLFGMIGAAALVVARLLGYLSFLSLTTVTVVGIALLTVLGAWWLYVFIDWRNDIFQLTSDHIVDIDRKPLGSEEKKSAPLENILSLRHERIGIWGLLFNFGTVSARIGKADFTFNNVHNPAQVQQDIFSRMDERQSQKREAEAARERARMAEWLAAYYRNVEGFHQAEQTTNQNDNSEMADSGF